MTNWLNRLMTTSNGRPLTAAEGERLAEYAESLPDRLAAVRKLEESQKWLAKQLTDVVAPKAAEWGLPREALVNDFVQSLTAVAQAMLADDLEVMAETVVAPFRSLADALDIPADELGDLLLAAWSALSRRLEARPAALLQPYFRWAAEALDAGQSLSPSHSQSLVETPHPVEV